MVCDVGFGGQLLALLLAVTVLLPQYRPLLESRILLQDFIPVFISDKPGRGPSKRQHRLNTSFFSLLPLETNQYYFLSIVDLLKNYSILY